MVKHIISLISTFQYVDRWTMGNSSYIVSCFFFLFFHLFQHLYSVAHIPQNITYMIIEVDLVFIAGTLALKFAYLLQTESDLCRQTKTLE